MRAFTDLHMAFNLFQVIKIISADAAHQSVIIEVFLDYDRLCVSVCSCVGESDTRALFMSCVHVLRDGLAAS